MDNDVSEFAALISNKRYSRLQTGKLVAALNEIAKKPAAETTPEDCKVLYLAMDFASEFVSFAWAEAIEAEIYRAPQRPSLGKGGLTFAQEIKPQFFDRKVWA
jgi:hypothetical protein